VNQSAGNSSLQSVMYFPQKTPSESISLGMSSGQKSGRKFRPTADKPLRDFGGNPPQLTAKKLMRLALQIPIDWTERKLLGFHQR
jgi:hypothetical protein